MSKIIIQGGRLIDPETGLDEVGDLVVEDDRILGLYSMSALGLMTFSGITVGFGGSVVGIHWSLGLSAGVLLAIIAGMGYLVMRGMRAQPG